MSESETEFATVTVTVDREIRIPIDSLGDDEPLPGELRERAEDWFWNFWRESLANEPGPSKDDVSVSTVTLPRSAHYDGDDRICTGCGTSVEGEPYLLWLFFTCRDCAQGSNDTETTETGDDTQ